MQIKTILTLGANGNDSSSLITTLHSILYTVTSDQQNLTKSNSIFNDITNFLFSTLTFFML